VPRSHRPATVPALALAAALAALVALLLAAAACTRDVDTPPPEAGAVGCDPALAAWAERGFSGAAAVLRAGEVECLGGYGEADRASGAANTGDTVFRIGSVTKAVTAAAVLDLADQGRLSLDDRAGDLVPGLGGPAALATVGQLLDHRSGLTGAHASADDQPMDHDEAVAAISALGVAFEPGTDETYSNAGYTLLALIVDARAGTTYRDQLASETLRLAGGRRAGGFWDGEPAAPGPRAVGFVDGDPADGPGPVEGGHWALDGAGGLAMSAADLAAWVDDLFSERFPGRTDLPGWGPPPGLHGERVLATAGGGDGSGHEAVVAWLPESERAFVLLSNGDEITAEQLMQRVLPAFALGAPLPEPPDRPAPAGAGLPPPTEAAGTYRLDTGGALTLAAVGDGLVLVPSGADALAALFPLPSGVSGEQVGSHEGHVRALLDGETAEGRAERAALEAEVGTIDRVEVVGTVQAGGELRTYVRAVGSGGERHAWYALDRVGGLAAAEILDGPPALTVVAGGDAYRPDDPAGTGPDVTIRFVGQRLAVQGPRGIAFADRES
jgi:CubicO group peptidase (beta-lactamase class C family)